MAMATTSGGSIAMMRRRHHETPLGVRVAARDHRLDADDGRRQRLLTSSPWK
jgi:hypothetical protein